VAVAARVVALPAAEFLLNDAVVEAAVVKLDARQRNPFRKRKRTILKLMRMSRASALVPRGVRAGCQGVAQPSRSSPPTLPTVHVHGSAAAARAAGGIKTDDVARAASWSASGASTAAPDAPERALPVVILRAVACLPTASEYTSNRRSWRRVEGFASFKHTPHLGDTDDAHAAAATIIRKNGWTAPDCNIDGSDASDNEPSHLENRYHSLKERIFRIFQRGGVCAVVQALGDSPAMVHTLSEVLGETLHHMTHVVELFQRRGDDHRRAASEREAQATLQAALEQLTGSVSISVVLSSGAVREHGRPCGSFCASKPRERCSQGSNPRLPDTTRTSRLVRVGALLPTRLPMRLPRGLVTAGAFHICTRAILSEIVAISHFQFLRV